MDILSVQTQLSDMEKCLSFLRVANLKLPLVQLRKRIWTRYCCVKSPTASMMLDRFIMIMKHLTRTHQFTQIASYKCEYPGRADDRELNVVRKCCRDSPGSSLNYSHIFCCKKVTTEKTLEHTQQVGPETSLTTTALNIETVREFYVLFEKHGSVRTNMSKNKGGTIEFRLCDKENTMLKMSIKMGNYGGSRMTWPRFYVRKMTLFYRIRINLVSN